MTIETTVPDVAAHPAHPEDQVDLIADAVASGDAAVIRDALNMVARARGMTQVAREAGVTREALYRALGPEGDPRMSTLLGVFGALGVRLSASSSVGQPTGEGSQTQAVS